MGLASAVHSISSYMLRLFFCRCHCKLQTIWFHSCVRRLHLDLWSWFLEVALSCDVKAYIFVGSKGTPLGASVKALPVLMLGTTSGRSVRLAHLASGFLICPPSDHY